jgi:hypothetical protein
MAISGEALAIVMQALPRHRATAPTHGVIRILGPVFLCQPVREAVKRVAQVGEIVVGDVCRMQAVAGKGPPEVQLPICMDSGIGRMAVTLGWDMDPPLDPAQKAPQRPVDVPFNEPRPVDRVEHGGNELAVGPKHPSYLSDCRRQFGVFEEAVWLDR